MLTENWPEKYRPRSLSDFWQSDDPGLNAVRTMLESGAMPQLLILVGEFGCGKSSLARAVGRRFLCINPDTPTGDPCGYCDGCSELNYVVSGTIATDGYLELDAATLSAARILEAIQEHVHLNRLACPTDPRFRRWIVCIDEVVHADPKLQQMLVKLIENLNRARFILCYSDPSRILPALLNRGVLLRLNPATSAQATEAIIRIAKAEGFRLEIGTARMLVESVRCLPRACIKTLELAARLSNGRLITPTAVQSALAMTGEV